MSFPRRIYRAFVRPALKRVHEAAFGAFDDYLKESRGLIHIGANDGAERERYARLGLNVLWIEPIPSVFERLQANIAGSPGQRAVQALVSNVDDQEVDFNVASNGGASSSLLDFKAHKEMWPEVTFESALRLRTVTLPTLLARHEINLAPYDSLLLDVQGAELLILEGARPLLRRFRYVQAEAADFESYAGGATRAQIDAFMAAEGFSVHARKTFARRQGVGTYEDVVYRRRADAI